VSGLLLMIMLKAIGLKKRADPLIPQPAPDDILTE
jgi:hypothetical protein